MDDDDDDEAQEHKGNAKQRQRGLDATAQCLAISAEWACCVVGSKVWLLRMADQSLTSLDLSTASCACFDASGTRLLVGGDDKKVILYETLLTDKAATRSWTASKKIGRVAFSPCGQTAMWADLFGEVHGVALSDADAAPELVLGHLSPVSQMTFTSCGGALLTSDREGHVRSSLWPHAFVIECYYLWHTKPLLLLIPLVSSPLILTAAADGYEVCAWRLHGGALLNRFPAAQLLAGCSGNGAAPGSALAEAGANVAAVACACEVSTMQLVAIGFAGRQSISFCRPDCEWDASAAQLLPQPDLECGISGEPLAMAHNASSSFLCVLLRGGTGLVLLPEATGGSGFNAKAAIVVSLDPGPTAPPTADDASASIASKKPKLA